MAHTQMFFTRTFVHHVEKFATGDTSNAQKTLRLLSPITSHLDCEEFTYKSDSEMHSGQAALLKCWTTLMEKVRVLRTVEDGGPHYAEALMNAILHLIARKEFSIPKLEDVDTYSQFIDLLAATVRFGETALMTGLPHAESFATHVLACGFMHFPTIASSIVELCQKADKKVESDFLQQEIEDACDLSSRIRSIDVSLSKQLILQTNSVYFYRCEMYDDFIYTFSSHLAVFIKNSVILPPVVAGFAGKVFRSILYSMRALPPPRWLLATCNAVTNISQAAPYVLTVAVKLDFMRTNAHDPLAVDGALSRLELWLESLRNKGIISSVAAQFSSFTINAMPRSSFALSGPLDLEALRAALPILDPGSLSPGDSLTPPNSLDPVDDNTSSSSSSVTNSRRGTESEIIPPLTEQGSSFIAQHPLDVHVFDYQFMHKALVILLDSDHFGLTLRSFKFLFHFMEDFAPQFTWTIFWDILLKKYFYRFFLHWHTAVRQAFHRILLVKGSGLKIETLKVIRVLTSFEEMETLAYNPVLRTHVGFPKYVRLCGLAVKRALWAVRSICVYLAQCVKNPSLMNDPPKWIYRLVPSLEGRDFVYISASLSEFRMLIEFLVDRTLSELDMPFAAPLTMNMV